MNDLPLRLRPMRLSDLDAVMALEEELFSLPWPARIYESELKHNPDGYYYILELMALGSPSGDGQRPAAGQVVGYAGFWLLGDEAHLMTIGITSEWQGHGLGEWLLLDMLDAMQARGARLATLEVRSSNQRAQSLYRRLGFSIAGLRRRYYSDNREDALIMTSPALDSPAMAALRCQRRAIVGRRLAHFLER